MAAYTQYTEASNNQTTVSQRLLNNGSDYLSVRVGQYDYLILQGDMDKSGNLITYTNCKKWVYTTSSYGNVPDLEYTESDSGTVTVSVPAYAYGSFDEYQRLDVMEVMNSETYTDLIILGILLISTLFNCFSRVRNRIRS